MGWNYRVVKNNRGEFGIHEAYYNKKGDKKPHSITSTPVDVYSSESLDGLKWVIKHMKKALDKPILNYGDFCQEEKNDKKDTFNDLDITTLVSMRKGKCNKNK